MCVSNSQPPQRCYALPGRPMAAAPAFGWWRAPGFGGGVWPFRCAGFPPATLRVVSGVLGCVTAALGSLAAFLLLEGRAAGLLLLLLAAAFVLSSTFVPGVLGTGIAA